MESRQLLESELCRLAAGIAADQGAELVELSLRGSGGRRMLRVDIDRAGARGVDLADCQRVSQALAAALDRADLIPGAYVLEVSTPGIDRPIRSEDDIRRNTGRRILVTTDDEEHRQHSYSGLLLGLEEDCLLLQGEDERTLRIPRNRILTARQHAGF